MYLLCPLLSIVKMLKLYKVRYLLDGHFWEI